MKHGRHNSLMQISICLRTEWKREPLDRSHRKLQLHFNNKYPLPPVNFCMQFNQISMIRIQISTLFLQSYYTLPAYFPKSAKANAILTKRIRRSNESSRHPSPHETKRSLFFFSFLAVRKEALHYVWFHFFFSLCSVFGVSAVAMDYTIRGCNRREKKQYTLSFTVYIEKKVWAVGRVLS